MTQKRLNHANIDILLEEVRGEAVPQRVRRHALLDPGGLARLAVKNATPSGVRPATR